MAAEEGLIPRLFANIIRAANAPIRSRGAEVGDETRGAIGRWSRELADTLATRAGYGLRYPEPDGAGYRIAALAPHLAGLDRTYRALADERSRALLVELLTFRALGECHARLPINKASFRAEQARVERDLLEERGTLVVQDPFVPHLDRFRVPAVRGRDIALHSHAAAIVPIFVLEQYAYRGEGQPLRADPGQVVIDAGACWGDTALYFADLVAGAPHGEVHAFEFSPDSLTVLERNLEMNPSLAKRIRIVERALWSSTDEELAFRPLGQLTTLAHGGDQRTRTITLDAFVENAGIERVDWIKMDIEGAEFHALRGAEQTLRAHRPTLSIAAYHRPEDLATIPAWIDELGLGYRLFLGHASPGNDETVLFAQPN